MPGSQDNRKGLKHETDARLAAMQARYNAKHTPNRYNTQEINKKEKQHPKGSNARQPRQLKRIKT